MRTYRVCATFYTYIKKRLMFIVDSNIFLLLWVFAGSSVLAEGVAVRGHINVVEVQGINLNNKLYIVKSSL